MARKKPSTETALTFLDQLNDSGFIDPAVLKGFAQTFVDGLGRDAQRLHNHLFRRRKKSIPQATRPPQVFIYTRVSNFKTGNVSPEAQYQACVDYAKYRLPGLPVSPLRFQDNSVSGGVPLLARPHGRRLCQQMQPGDQLVVYHMTRLFRNTRDMLGMSAVWEGRGIVWHETTTGVVSDTAAGRFLRTVLAAAAQLERELASERKRVSNAMRKQNGGVLCSAPAGFKVVGTGPKAVYRPDKSRREVPAALIQIMEEEGVTAYKAACIMSHQIATQQGRKLPRYDQSAWPVQPYDAWNLVRREKRLRAREAAAQALVDAQGGVVTSDISIEHGTIPSEIAG